MFFQEQAETIMVCPCKEPEQRMLLFVFYSLQVLFQEKHLGAILAKFFAKLV